MPFLNSLIVRWLASLRACVDASRGRSGSGSRIVKTISVIKNPLPNYLTTQLPPSKGWSASGGNWRQRRQGFSLVELLIGILIIGLISTFIASIYLSHFKLFTGQSLAISVADQNKIAMDEIVNNIRQATQVYGNGTGTLPCNKNNCDISITAACGGTCLNPYTRNNGVQLVLQLWPLDSNGNPFDPATIAGCYPDHISYYLGDDPTQTNQQPPSGSPTLDTDGYYHLTRETKRNLSNCSTRQSSKDIIATKILSINFTYTPSTPNTTEVKITLTNEGKALWKAFNPYTYSRTSLARLKNRPGSNIAQINFPYAVQSLSTSSNLSFGGSSTTTTGNVRSNASINCGGSTITGTAFYASGSPSNCQGINVSQLAADTNGPLSASDIEAWKISAAKTQTTCPFGTCTFNSGSVTLNGKYIGNVDIQLGLNAGPNANVNVTGPVHITGNLKIGVSGGGNRPIVVPDPSLGPACGTVIVATGEITIISSDIKASLTDPKGYLLFVSEKVSSIDGMDITPNFALSAIFFAPNGRIQVRSGSGGETGSVVGNEVSIATNANVTYGGATNLQPGSFCGL